MCKWVLRAKKLGRVHGGDGVGMWCVGVRMAARGGKVAHAWAGCRPGPAAGRREFAC